MIAALQEALNIKAILIVDGNGILNRHCIFCAKFLQERGFKIKAHFEGICNYNIPSKKQIETARNWFLQLSQDYTRYQYIGPKTHEKQSRKHETETLQQKHVNQIIKHYPSEPERRDIKAKRTYCSAKGLANSYCGHFSRIRNYKGNISRKNIKNLRISIKRDGRIKPSKEDPNKLIPESPKSPRSSQFCNKINLWGGKTSKLFITDDNYLIDREFPETKNQNTIQKLVKEFENLKI